MLDGTVIGRNMARHRHQEFIRFLNAVGAAVSAGKQVHAILDNYAAHKHPKVRSWLDRHPRWTFHFVPTSCSWLNVGGATQSEQTAIGIVPDGQQLQGRGPSMRLFTASVALCALLAAAPVAAQNEQPATDGTGVYRNDLPETHDGMNLPEVSHAGGDLPADATEALRLVSEGALAAQQYGNLAAAKYAGGAIRDLGDRMILLHSAADDRLSGPGEEDDSVTGERPTIMGQNVRADLEVLDGLNGPAFDQAFATWVVEVYPGLIEVWSRLGQAEGYAELAQAVTPELEEQLAVAQDVLSGAGGQQAAAEEPAGEAVDPRQQEPDGPVGAEGQTEERQHTQEPEPPAVQTGENYQHEQVEVDPQSRTRSLPEGAPEPDVAPPAGELDILNPGAVFSLIENVPTEMAQLEQAPEYSGDQVRVVAVADHLSQLEMETLHITLAEHESDLSSLREAVGARSGLVDALSRAGVSTEDLVAFDVIDEGIVLYTRQQQDNH